MEHALRWETVILLPLFDGGCTSEMTERLPARPNKNNVQLYGFLSQRVVILLRFIGERLVCIEKSVYQIQLLHIGHECSATTVMKEHN